MSGIGNEDEVSSDTDDSDVTEAGVAAQQFPVQCFPLWSVRMRVTRDYGNVYFLSCTGLVVPLM